MNSTDSRPAPMSKKPIPLFLSTKAQLSEEMKARAHEISWWHQMPLGPDLTTRGHTSVIEVLPHLGIPEDLTGKRVLDIGCSDGFFSFLAERRGAKVVAIDTLPTLGFEFAHRILGSEVEFHQMSAYDVSPERLGLFDIVFFLGVYYHLKNPICALERIASVTGDFVVVESAVLAETWAEELSISRLFESDKPDDDATQYCLPTIPYLLRSVRAGGFPRVELTFRFSHPQRGSRAVVRGHKTPLTKERILSESIVIRIDQPRRGQILHSRGSIVVEGWVVDSNDLDGKKMEAVQVFLDGLDGEGILLGSAQLHQERPDVARHIKVTQFCGYRFTGKLPPVDLGYHMFYVSAHGASGWNFHTQSVKVQP